MLDKAQTKSFTVALWGGSQVGKTSVLAAYLGHLHEYNDWIDTTHEPSNNAKHVFVEIWNRLISNQLVSGTVEASNFELRHKEGWSVQFRDMKGGLSYVASTPTEDTRALQSADAAMLFVEWPGPGTENRLRPALDALHLLQKHLPVALVITKCEGYLTKLQLRDFASDPIKFASKNSIPSQLAELLNLFKREFRSEGADIFPVTVYGWHNDRPALFLDEFGRNVPWRIDPIFVYAPFIHIIDSLRG